MLNAPVRMMHEAAAMNGTAILKSLLRNLRVPSGLAAATAPDRHGEGQKPPAGHRLLQFPCNDPIRTLKGKEAFVYEGK
ncbi:hypothetical protein [Labrys neptuniae]